MKIQWKEFGLWLAFLIFCLGAGFLHGSLPDIQFRFFFENPEKIQIVTYDKSLLPSEAILEIEKKQNVEIHVIEISKWEDLRVKVVLNQGPHLLLIPQSWVVKLQREGRLRNINPLKKKINSLISEQFMPETVDKIYFAPLYWTLTNFMTSPESDFKDFNDALKSQKLNNIELYKDLETVEKRMQSSDWQSLRAKNKINISDNVIPENIKTEKNIIYEYPQQYKNKNLMPMTNPPFAQLQVYGFAVANNTPSR